MRDDPGFGRAGGLASQPDCLPVAPRDWLVQRLTALVRRLGMKVTGNMLYCIVQDEREKWCDNRRVIIRKVSNDQIRLMFLVELISLPLARCLLHERLQQLEILAPTGPQTLSWHVRTALPFPRRGQLPEK